MGWVRWVGLGLLSGLGWVRLDSVGLGLSLGWVGLAFEFELTLLILCWFFSKIPALYISTINKFISLISSLSLSCPFPYKTKSEQ